jgi:hypothetical protein
MRMRSAARQGDEELASAKANRETTDAWNIVCLSMLIVRRRGTSYC